MSLEGFSHIVIEDDKGKYFKLSYYSEEDIIPEDTTEIDQS